MAASSRAQVLRLYRALLRESQRFGSYNYRTYAIRRIRDAFRENKNIKDSEKIEELVNKAKANLEVIHRQSHRCCQETAPARTSHGVTASFRTCPLAPAWGPPQAADGSLLHHVPPQAAGAQPAPLWSSPWAAGESVLWCLEHLLLLLLHRPWRPQSCFSHIFSIFFPAAIAGAQQFFPLLKYVIPEVLPPLLMGSALASDGSVLEPAGIGSVGHGGRF
ncbi:LYR motif-containing protein 4 isoform X1 [Strix aluco]|uniref:LYR motif-containing protein 4 isoform X1 n=1 Tax=Strix aluco TaxID=111821 RepID=UPI003DA39140